MAPFGREFSAQGQESWRRVGLQPCHLAPRRWCKQEMITGGCTHLHLHLHFQRGQCLQQLRYLNGF
jgi:hypothetical protein